MTYNVSQDQDRIFFWSETGLVLRPTVSDHITGWLTDADCGAGDEQCVVDRPRPVSDEDHHQDLLARTAQDPRLQEAECVERFQSRGGRSSVAHRGRPTRGPGHRPVQLTGCNLRCQTRSLISLTRSTPRAQTRAKAIHSSSIVHCVQKKSEHP